MDHLRVLSLILLTILIKRTVSNEKVRIIGGTSVNIQDCPYQVALFKGTFICGGVIISSTKVLTARHCVENTPVFQLTIRVGSSSRTGGTAYSISNKAVFKKNAKMEFDNDVAVLTTAKPIVFSDSVAPINLTFNRPPDGADVMVSGWGSSFFGGPAQEHLQRVTIKIIKQNDCQDQYKNKVVITQSMICAGIPQQVQGACPGDSGGPLVYEGELVGTVSFGVNCSQPTHAEVYASVADLRSWILEQVNKNSANSGKGISFIVKRILNLE